MEELLRCPLFEQPSLEYFEVRLPWQGFAVRRECAERVLEAVSGLDRVEWVRLETMGGSVVWVRTDHIVHVREWSSAQRESERRFWQQIDDEYEEADKKHTEEKDGQTKTDADSEGSALKKAGKVRLSLCAIVLTLCVTWLVLAVLRIVTVV